MTALCSKITSRPFCIQKLLHLSAPDVRCQAAPSLEGVEGSGSCATPFTSHCRLYVSCAGRGGGAAVVMALTVMPEMPARAPLPLLEASRKLVMAESSGRKPVDPNHETI